MTGDKVALTPLADRVIVVPDDPETCTPGGIALPDMGKKKPNSGRVLAVGEGRTENGSLIPVKVGEGDRVLFPAFTGSEIEVDGQTLVVLKEGDLLASYG